MCSGLAEHIVLAALQMLLLPHSPDRITLFSRPNAGLARQAVPRCELAACRWGDLDEVPKKKGAKPRSGSPHKEGAALEVRPLQIPTFWLAVPAASYVAQACLLLQEPDAQKQPRMAALMKKNLTSILIDVTDSLFSELCTARLAHDGDVDSLLWSHDGAPSSACHEVAA